MLAHAVRALLVLALTAAPSALAQTAPAGVEGGAALQDVQLSPSRLAAGVRAYPAAVLRSLIALSQQPLVARQLAEQPELLDHPERIDPPVGAELQGAIRELQAAPEIVMLAAAYPNQLAALRQLYADAPEGMELRTAELRAAYQAAEIAGARAWQQLLEASPPAADAYRELLTRFCRDQLKGYAAFPHVEVLRREYYLACPPNDLILAYAEAQQPPEALCEVLQRWWTEQAPEQVDERVLTGKLPPLAGVAQPDCIAALPPQARASMWRLPGADEPVAVGLAPIIMQPPADQPPGARLAFAVAEHARLWAPQEVPEEAPVVAEAEELEPGYQQAPDGDDGFKPWIVYADDGVPHDRRYGDAPDHDRDYARVYGGGGAIDWNRGVGYSSGSYRIYYNDLYPYYCGYPWTWPLVSCDYPWWSRQAVCGNYFGYGSGARVEYRGSKARVSFRIGGGATLYHDCPLYRPHRRPHTQRTVVYRRHRSYATPTPARRGYSRHVVRGSRIPTGSYRRGSGSAQRGAAVGRRPATRGPSRSSGVIRRPAVRRSSPPTRYSGQRRTIIRRPSRTSRSSGAIQPRRGTSTPQRGSSVRPSNRRPAPTRRSAVRPSSTRRSGDVRRAVRPPSRSPRSGVQRGAIQRRSSRVAPSPRGGIQRSSSHPRRAVPPPNSPRRRR